MAVSASLFAKVACVSLISPIVFFLVLFKKNCGIGLNMNPVIQFDDLDAATF